jgi:hypothetical protein
MVVTATLSKCGGALSCEVPVGKQCVLGRSTARDSADALKLALGVSPKEDGVSRRQATLKIEASGQAKLIVPLGVCNPVKVTSHDGTSMMLQAGRTAFLHSGDIVALDSYNKDPRCKIELLLTNLSTAKFGTHYSHFVSFITSVNRCLQARADRPEGGISCWPQRSAVPAAACEHPCPSAL